MRNYFLFRSASFSSCATPSSRVRVHEPCGTWARFQCSGVTSERLSANMAMAVGSTAPTPSSLSMVKDLAYGLLDGWSKGVFALWTALTRFGVPLFASPSTVPFFLSSGAQRWRARVHLCVSECECVFASKACFCSCLMDHVGAAYAPRVVTRLGAPKKVLAFVGSGRPTGVCTHRRAGRRVVLGGVERTSGRSRADDAVRLGHRLAEGRLSRPVLAARGAVGADAQPMLRGVRPRGPTLRRASVPQARRAPFAHITRRRRART